MSFDLLKHIRENDEYTVIWLFNIGVEKYWNSDVFTVKSAGDDTIVAHMEEMNLLITRPQDILILRDEPDTEYLEEMKRFGAEIPSIVCPNLKDDDKSISEIVLEDDELAGRIREMISDKDKVVFVPYGVSSLEEKIAEKLGVSFFGPSCESAVKVNDKVYSRKFAIEHDFKVPEGKVCLGYDELCEAAGEYLDRFGKIIIKEPHGASGKGLWVIETAAKLKSTLLIIKRFYDISVEREWIVEQWCDKLTDLNYQIYVGGSENDPKVEVFSVKEQRVSGTVYTGSVIPPSFDEKITRQCIECGMIIGRELMAEGYRGVLGIDAMILSNGELIPIVEINGRFTLSTYLSFIPSRCKGVTDKIFASYRRIRLGSGDNYKTAVSKLADAGISYKGDDGVFIYTSETIRADRVGEYGRLFTLCMGHDERRTDELLDKCKEVIE